MGQRHDGNDEEGAGEGRILITVQIGYLFCCYNGTYFLFDDCVPALAGNS